MLRQSILGVLGRSARARSLCAGEWKMLPSGVQWRQVRSGDQGDPPIEEGQTVRINYTVRRGDGRVLAKHTASFKVGSPQICAALNVGIVGMCVGDRRRLKAGAYSRRGPRVAALSAEGEALEYDVQLTGAVHHMQIVTLAKEGDDDPLQILSGIASRAFEKIANSLSSKSNSKE